MASYSCILAWRIPWTEEPGGLQSIGSQRVRHNNVTEHIGVTSVLHACEVLITGNLPVVKVVFLFLST